VATGSSLPFGWDGKWQDPIWQEIVSTWRTVYWAAATSVLSASIFMAALRCGASHGWVVASHPHVSNVITGRNARRTLLGLQIPINLHLSLDTTLRSRKEDSLALRSGRYESLGHELELLYYSTICAPHPPFALPSSPHPICHISKRLRLPACKWLLCLPAFAQTSHPTLPPKS
jgi:hypothetical protein